MYISKYLIFIFGMAAAVGSMFALSYFSQNNLSADTASLAPEEVQTAAPVTPFSIVDETPVDESSIIESPPATEELSTETEVALDEALALIERLEDAEDRIEALETELAEVRLQQFLPANNLTESQQTEVLSAVFEPVIVENIKTIRNDAQLQRLELRDRAIREGWINSDRFREESAALRSDRQLRETLGDDAFDKLLVAEGRDNRVRIETVIENSAADISGIEVGDVVVRYADDRVFQFGDLRDATTAGERDETVSIQVRRDGEVIDLVIPRGPMGVSLSRVTEPALQ